MKKYSKKRKSTETSFFGFIFESEAAFFLILANVIAFWFFRYFHQGRALLGTLMLYPANLFDGKYICLITSGFIHHDWSHLLLNMLGVFVFGRIVERHLGIGKTYLIYFGALFISMLFSIIVYVFVMHTNVAIIGASGAVMGLVAAAMLLDPFCITYEMIFPIPVMVKGWMFFYMDVKGLLSGQVGGVSHLAHLFGFLSIAFLVYFLSDEEQQKMRTGLLINIASFAIFFITGWWIARS